MTFSGEVAWVTGSSKGIGRAVAVALAEAGCDVVVHYGGSDEEAREVAGEVESFGRKALLVQGDVSDAGDVERMVEEIGARFGGVDVLVNNAGSFVERRAFEELDGDLWDRIMAVNLKSVFLVTRAVLPLMRRRGGGRIVNMSSIVAKSGGSADSIAYAAAKGGVDTLTRGLAGVLVADNILVNAVAPGRIDTPLHDEFTPEERRQRAAQGIPLEREGTPEEVAATVVFLASPAAGYVVGETLEVNGGLRMG